MSSNKYLSAFLTSAAALGGLYLLNRLLGDKARANPSIYSHVKTFDEFNNEEKLDIAKRYDLNKEPINSIARLESTTPATIRRILENQGCEIRERKDAHLLATKKELKDAQKADVIRLFEIHQNIPLISEQLQIPRAIVTKFLVEKGLHEIKKAQELSDDDKEKLIAAKKEANAKGERLALYKIGTKLGLTHKDVEAIVVVRLFAENNLNRPEDLSSSLTEEQEQKILSYFTSGVQEVTLEHIMKDVGVSVGVLRNFLLYNNIIPREAGSFNKQELEQWEKDLIIRLLEEGKTSQEIYLQLKTSEYTANKFIDEYRAQQGRTTSRKSEIKKKMRDRLVTRDPDVVLFIMSERNKTPPTSYETIARKLREEKNLTITGAVVRSIYHEEMTK